MSVLVLKPSNYGILIMYFVIFWDGCPWKDTPIILSRLLVGSVRKGRHHHLGVGDGWTVCKPFSDWSKQRFEATKRNLIGRTDSHEGSHAKDLRKGLLFLCFREPEFVCYLLSSTIK